MPLQNGAKLFLPTERVALFIDGANLYSASRNLGFDVDYRNLLEYFRRQAHVIRAYYYSAVLDIEVAVDMLELAPKIDHAVLFSGDSDFRRLVEAVQRKGVRVSVVSSIRT